MEAKDIKKYGKELAIIGRKLNDLGARCALRYENDEQTLGDICKVGEDVFEVSFKAGIQEVVEWINENNAFAHYSQKGHNPIGSYADDCWACWEWEAQQKKWGVKK